MGFFLAETIVMVALVTTVMAFVFPNVSKIYENYKNQMKYYDQTEDIYVLKAVYENLKAKKSLSSTIETNITSSGKEKTLAVTDSEFIEKIYKGSSRYRNNYDYFNCSGCSGDTKINSKRNATAYWRANGLSKLYISKYLGEAKDDNYSFNRYLKRMKKSTNDVNAYRLIGVFDILDGDIVKGHRYASIKIQKAW